MIFRLSQQKRSSLSHVDRNIAMSFGAVVMMLMLLMTGVATWLFAQQQNMEEDHISAVLAATLKESIDRNNVFGKDHAGC